MNRREYREDGSRECERIETAEEVETRYGVPYEVVTRHLMRKEGLFLALNPYTNVRMVVGELPEEEVKRYAGWRKERGIVIAGEKRGDEKRMDGSGENPIAFLWYGPSTWLELVLSLLVLPLVLVLQMVRFLVWIGNEIESTTRDIGCCKNYDAYAGGEGLFDAVNDMRRSDIEYLLGGRR